MITLVAIPISFILLTYAAKHRMELPVKTKNYPDVDLSEVKVSIQLCTYNEEDFVLQTIYSILDQPLFNEYRKNIEFVLIDSYSTDNTVELARPYVDRIIYAPRGIFTSRNLGAKQTDADIIVGIDAAEIYPEGWLNLLLRHFSDPNVVAVTGAKISAHINIFHLIGNIWFSDILTNHIWGDNYAVRRNIFLLSGGWREDINQFSFKETFKEEYDFFNRLKQYGKVVKDLEAVAYDIRTRFACTFNPEELKVYCEQIRRGERF